jgi:hypothetical protein
MMWPEVAQVTGRRFALQSGAFLVDTICAEELFHGLNMKWGSAR